MCNIQYLRLIIFMQASDDKYYVCSSCDGMFLDVEDYTDENTNDVPDKIKFKRGKEESDGK